MSARTLRARDNPFRTSRIGTLAFRHPQLTTRAIASRLEALGRRGAIVGPKGSGKTTLLGELGTGLADGGFAVRTWRLHADRPPAPPRRALEREACRLGPRDVLLVDGIGHLAPGTRWRLGRAAQSAGGLLVTAHQPIRWLPTLLETRTDPPLLADLVRELLGTPSESLGPLLEVLFERHRGNVRDVLLALYDRAADGDPRLAPLQACAR